LKHETLFTLREAAQVILQRHQMLHLPRKIALIISLLKHETLFTMRGATGITLQPHQMLRLPLKIAFPNRREICRKRLKCHFQRATDPRMIRDPSDQENANRNPPRH